MTRETLAQILDQADEACAVLKRLRDKLATNGVALKAQEEIEDAMRAVVRLDQDLGRYAVDIIRRNA